MTEIVRVDSRGRVTLPSPLRDAVRLPEGVYVMLVADLDKKEIRIVPFADPEAKLVEIHITFADVPGALARVATILAKEGVDLLSTESRSLRRGESAEWVAIVDISKCKVESDELKRKLMEDGAATEVSLRGFP
jgi:AbrB family looped-hinge helix DNA binding protein